MTVMQNTWKRVRPSIKADYLWWGIILLGVALRLRQYLLNRPFWTDEANLAVNLVTRNFEELTQLLDYHQAAPVGFLFIEKIFILIFGNHDYVMRIFPLIAGILAIYLIYKFARASFGPFGLFAVAMFSITWWLVYYSSELKQYCSDVTVALLLVYLARNCLKERIQPRDFLTLGVVGAVVIWISHPSVFIMAGIGLVLVLEKFSRKEYAPWIWILGIGIGWLGSFGLEYLVSLRHIVADEYLIDYWGKAYVPVPPWSDKRWFVDTYYTFLLFAFHRADRVMAIIMLVLASIGSISLLIRDRKIALLVILPFVTVAIASALERYPLKNRFMLFLIPFALLLMAEGLRGIYWLIAKWKPNVSAVLSVLLAFMAIWQIVPTTYNMATSGRRVGIRSVMDYIAENKEQDDIIYVFYRTESTFRYYAPFYGLDTANVVAGEFTSRKRIALQNYEDDVQSFIRKERVWFLFSEVIDCENCPEDDTLSYYLEFIEPYGVVIDKFEGFSSSAYLYDLSQ
jgi:hypothetical protein